MHPEFESLKERHPDLTPIIPDILSLAMIVRSTFRSGGKLLIAGNGGSAADCDHIAGELLKRFESPRPIHPDRASRLGSNLCENLEAALPTIPLPNLTALLTAWGNDRTPDYGFAQLVLGLGQPGDTLLCLTTSGNSANLLHAAATARALDIFVVALSGRGGGPLASLCDVSVDVPGDSPATVQELHLPIYHTLCRFWENSAFRSNHAQ